MGLGPLLRSHDDYPGASESLIAGRAYTYLGIGLDPAFDCLSFLGHDLILFHPYDYVNIFFMKRIFDCKALSLSALRFACDNYHENAIDNIRDNR